jgi:heparan-alpha-glucosaminide N-acetyltransferase
MQKVTVPRISAIDILRALTMTLMIFVNDLWSLSGIPIWLEHTAANDDGMGLADVVFPAFLVLVGMSAPFAIAARRSKGHSNRAITIHILQRSFALIVMGVFLVNGETLNARATGIPGWSWYPLCCFCFILIWNNYPKNFYPKLRLALPVSGWLVLTLLAWFFHGGSEGTERFATSWWGILGLIGWAYLISSLVLNYANDKLGLVVFFWLFCIGMNVAAHSGWLAAGGPLRSLLSPFQDASMPAFVTAGIISSMLFVKYKFYSTYRYLLLLLVASVVLIAAGFAVRPLNGISKIKATPSWVLICSGITLAAYAVVYWLVDVLKKEKWFNLIKPAGTNTLTCYLVPYFVYSAMNALAFRYPAAISVGAPGLIKSLLFAILVVIAGGWLGKRGVQVKL